MQMRSRYGGRPSRGPRWAVMARLQVADGTAGRVWAEAVANSMTPSDVVAAIVAAHYGSPTVSSMLRSTSSATRAGAPVETESHWSVKTFLPHAGGVADRVREQAEAEGISYGALVASIVVEHYDRQMQRTAGASTQAGGASEVEHRLGISA